MKRFTIFSLLLLLLAMVSCETDFDQIDTNPHGFTSASDGSLFNGVVSSLLPGWNEQFYVNNEILYKESQLAALTKGAWGNYTLGTEEIWSGYYTVLPSVRELERRFSSYDPSPSVTNMKAMLKIVLAYKTFKLTDLFGDVPFTEAGLGFQDLKYLHPKYDAQRDIYFKLLGDLEWAAEAINDTTPRVEPFTTFASFDKLFNGNLSMWRKFANSLRLRYAMRMSGREPEAAGVIIRDIIENDLPVLTGYDFTNPVLESACMWPAANGFTNGSLSWSFREHNGLRMGTNIWHRFSSTDEPDGSGIFDPRAYIFFEGDKDEKWTPFPQLPDASTASAQGIPYGSHRDDRDNYNIKNNVNYSPFNYFIIADENFMPVILMTGAEVHFLKAEAWFRGTGVAMDKDMADIEYMNGLNASVEWWMKTARQLKLPRSGVGFEEKISVPAWLNAASVLNYYGSWNAATEEEKLAFIYTQRWIDAFRQPWEAYAEARRTNAIPREGNAISHFRMPYPPSEIQYNSVNMSEAVSRQGGDDPSAKIWWISW